MSSRSSNMVWSTVNVCTAQITGDTERLRELGNSNSRRACRFLLTISALLGLIAIMTISLARQPPKRSQRVWMKKEDLHDATGFLDHMALQLNSVEWHCPCKATDVVARPQTGARLVDFFLIDAKHPENVIHVDSIDQFCSEVSGNSFFSGFNATCQKLLRESFRLSGWDFNIGSSNVYMNSLRMASLNPIAFMFDVCNSWAGGLSQASSFFLISNMGMREDETRRLDAFLRAIRTSLETCSKHTNWPPPEKSLYLSEAYDGEHREEHDSIELAANDLKYVVAMSLNWTHYFAVCAPSYCEHLQGNSTMWILFAGLAQIGGFVSVTLFALRTVLWPLFCMLFGWPTRLDARLEKGSHSSDPKTPS